MARGGANHPHRRPDGPGRVRRLLTDPTFDAAGAHYSFGWGTGSTKTTGPAIAAGEVGPIDAVLLSHDHHDDNLDPAGRALLPSAGTVVTTLPGAGRLGGTALLHLGGVRFPISGPLRYTMTAHDAVELCGLIRPHTAIPIHYEGWKHFREGREAVEQEFAGAPAEVREAIRWLAIGTPAAVGV